MIFFISYAIEWSIYNKVGGVLALAGSLLVWFILLFIFIVSFVGFLFGQSKSFLMFYFYFSINYIGVHPIEFPYISVSLCICLF